MAKSYVGIDFGASNIKAVAYNGKKIRKIKLNKNQIAGEEIPNIIYYDKNNEVKVGYPAQKEFDYKNKIMYIKRKLEQKSWRKYIENIGKNITAQEVATDIFKWLKKTISNTLSEDDFKAVITMPVCFSEVQKNRIYNAATDAKINVEAVVTEPFAALFSIEGLFEEAEDDEQVVLIFDFGGSTLDLSLLRIENDGDGEICVTELASDGMHYGGIDIDEDIYHEVFESKYTKEIAEIKAVDDLGTAEVELIDVVRKLKEIIFEDEEDKVDDIYHSRKGKAYTFELTKNEIISVFEKTKIKQRIIDLLDNLFETTDEVEKEDITNIKLFGGTSKIDYFREILDEYINDTDVFDVEDCDIEEIYTGIAAGAARYLYFKKEEEDTVEIHNIIPFSIGIEENGRFVKYINRNERYGFETLYRPLKMVDLLKNGYMLNIYQTFDDLLEADINADGIVFMGSVQLDKKLYIAKDAVLFKMKMAEDGRLSIRFFEQRLENGENEIVLVENKQLKIGG